MFSSLQWIAITQAPRVSEYSANGNVTVMNDWNLRLCHRTKMNQLKHCPEDCKSRVMLIISKVKGSTV